MKNLKLYSKWERYREILQSSHYQNIFTYLISIMFFVLITQVALILQNYTLLNDNGGLPVNFSALIALSVCGVFYFSYFLYRVLSWSSLFRFTIVYLVYMVASYGIFLGLNVNNPDIEAWDYVSNGFYQTNVLWVILSIMFLAYFLRFSYNVERFSEALPYKIDETFLFALFLSFCVLNDRLFLTSFQEQLIKGLAGNSFSVMRDLGTVLCIPILLVIVGSYVAYKAIQDFWENRPTLSTTVLTSFLLAVIFNYAIQLGIKGEEPLLEQYIFQGAVSYQIFILTVIFLLVYLCLNRFVLATFVNIFVFYIIAMANFVKESMRSEPLLITDFVWLTETQTVIEFVDRKIIDEAFRYVFFAVIVTSFLYFLILKGRIIHKGKQRLMTIFVLCGILGYIHTVFSNSVQDKIPSNIPVLSKLNNNNDVAWFGFTINARYKSLMYVWTKQITKQLMDKPEEYSQKRIENIVTKYSTVAEEINKTRSSSITEQTLIFVLSESFSNPEYVPGVHLSREVIPNIEAIKSQTTSGIMKSDAYGGGTANMEFQSLSGLPFYNFTPSVSLAYLEVVPHMSYFPAISDQFEPENRIVIHPASAKNYNRNIIYQDLGFGKFIAQYDSDNKLSAPAAVGALIGDWTVYANVLENLHSDKSQFFSVITMQNHSPWIMDNPADIIAEGDGFSEEANEKLTSYARLLSHTDIATKEFLERLSELEQKVTLVFYGDHLPGLYPQETFSERPETQYQTDYFIWSNYGNQNLKYPYINSSDFIATLFEHTDARVSPYVALLTEVLHKASINQLELTEEEQVIAEDLYLLQYDLTVGKGYIKNYLDFFEVE